MSARQPPSKTATRSYNDAARWPHREKSLYVKPQKRQGAVPPGVVPGGVAQPHLFKVMPDPSHHLLVIY